MNNYLVAVTWPYRHGGGKHLVSLCVQLEGPVNDPRDLELIKQEARIELQERLGEYAPEGLTVLSFSRFEGS